MVSPAVTTRDVRRFIDFPRSIYANDPSWVAPFPGEVRKRLDPTRNRFYATARRELFLAHRDGVAVGTVAAIIDDARNEALGETVGYFGYFETVDDPLVARALIGQAARWLMAAGASTVRGPVNGSAYDEIGVLVEGFGTRPALWQGHHPQYYQRLLEEMSLIPFDDELAYEITYDDIGRCIDNLPDPLLRVAEWARGKGATLRSPTAKSWNDDIAIAHRLYVRSHRTIPGHPGMSFEQFASVARSMRKVIDLNLAVVVEVDGEPVGFALAVPEVNEALARCGSVRTMWTPLRLMRELRRVRSVSLKLLGVLPEYRRRGLDALMCVELARRFVERGYERCEMSLVSERNSPMTAVLGRVGARIYRRYRVYEAPASVLSELD